MADPTILSPEATTAGVAAIVGGVVLKLIEKLWLSKTVVDEHAVLRKELREELDAVKDEIASLREEVDEWREKYYSQVETTNELLFEVSVLKTRLRKYESDSGEFSQDDF
jgi:uncharacterized coiled-coil DUF342 family protein